MKHARIAIGMPVRNGGEGLRSVLESLLTQTFTDFMLLISDNASTDQTEQICREYAASDPRIVYVRQPRNIGGEGNFRYVFNVTDSDYFMWAAADDLRSSDFLHINFEFLDRHPEYVASTSPVRFKERDFDEIVMGDAKLADDDRFERVLRVFEVWHANGRFYSLYRRDSLAAWIESDWGFLGADWTLVTQLSMLGKFNRTEGGWVALGVRGVSNSNRIFSLNRRSWLDFFVPFRTLAIDTWGLMSGASAKQKLTLAGRLARLNLQAFVRQFVVILQRRRRLDKPV